MHFEPCTSNHALQTPNSKLQTPNSGFRTSDFGPCALNPATCIRCITASATILQNPLPPNHLQPMHPRKKTPPHAYAQRPNPPASAATWPSDSRQPTSVPRLPTPRLSTLDIEPWTLSPAIPNEKRAGRV